MRTNVKNGVFMVGFIPVDTAQIQISDAITNDKPIIFELVQMVFMQSLQKQMNRVL